MFETSRFWTAKDTSSKSRCPFENAVLFPTCTYPGSVGMGWQRGCIKQTVDSVHFRCGFWLYLWKKIWWLFWQSTWWLVYRTCMVFSSGQSKAKGPGFSRTPATALWIQISYVQFTLWCPWVSASLPQSGGIVGCAMYVHPESWGWLEAGLTPGAIQNSLRVALGCADFWQSLWGCPFLACLRNATLEKEQ